MQRYKRLRGLSKNKSIVGACRKGRKSIVHSNIYGSFYVMHVSIWVGVGGRKGSFNWEFTVSFLATITSVDNKRRRKTDYCGIPDCNGHYHCDTLSCNNVFFCHTRRATPSEQR
jgi:hypothetical protein